MNERFESDFCTVEYIPEDHIVFLTWKKFACLDNYRKPTTFALELLHKYPNSQFIVDARNGFEDDPRDVEWGFSFLLPEMAKTSCQFVCFIMNEVNEETIGEEMDMWTKEFGKYFAVTKSTDYQSALLSTQQFLLVHVRYTIKKGKRAEFYHEVLKHNIVSASKCEPGNIKYDYYYPLDSEQDICLMEMWTTEFAQKLHGTSPHYQVLQTLKEKYVEHVSISKYNIYN
ncbi:MAG: hypothetical protein E7231_16580 [Cellulosilyticum sp.]|nr:hypothetical protein [Cellulosilyticum sp.]